MAHTKRIIAPGFWKMGKKTKYWSVTPTAGPHEKKRSIPLLALLRDVLRVAQTSKEAKAILGSKQVTVDGRVRAEKGYPLGLMDVVAVGEKHYRIVPYRLGLKPVEIDESESGLKLLRVTGKTALAKGKVQVTLHDSRNLLSDAGAKEYGIGDSVVFDLKANKPVEVMKLAKGQSVLIFDGTHRGELARVVSVQSNMASPDTVVLEGSGKRKSFETLTDYVLVVSPKIKSVAGGGAE